MDRSRRINQALFIPPAEITSTRNRDITDRITDIQSGLMTMSEENHLTDGRLTTLLNHFWSMRGRLSNKLTAEGAADTLSEKRYKKQLISLLDELIRECTGVQSITRQSGWLLKVSADRLHISQLRVLHRQWHDHIRAYVLSQTENAPVLTFHVNPVRDWYNNTGKTLFAHLPAFTWLGDALNRLQTATEELRLEGCYRMSPDLAPEKLQWFDEASQAVTGALGKLDEQVNRMSDRTDPPRPSATGEIS